MDFMSEGMSIADMVASAASEVFHSKVPPGFEYIEAYKQYYSRDTDYFYDPSTGLFFHNETQTYYIFNEETYQYEVYKCIRPLKWSGTTHETRAKKVLGIEFDRLDQEAANLCSLLMFMVDKVCKKESRHRENEKLNEVNEEGKVELLRRRLVKEQAKYKNREMIQTEDPGFVCFYSEEADTAEEPNRESSDEYFNLSGGDENDDGTELNEREKMIEDERISHAPLLRIIDQQKNLHIITIPGGTIGRDAQSDVVLDHPAIPEHLLHLAFVPENNSFVVKKVTYLRVLLNDYEMEFDEDKELVHGDIVYFQGQSLSFHVHFGNNTCPQCEPGLIQEATVQPVPRVVRGETARRISMKMLKAAYGLNSYEEQKFGGFDRAAHRRRHVGSEGPAIAKNRSSISSNVYSGCLARPVAAPSTSGYQKPGLSQTSTIGAENKGFKLLKGMGWQEGEGLGKQGKGRVDPVINDVKNNRAGLGAENQAEQKLKYNSQKESILDVTRRRYKQIDAKEKE